MLLTTARTRLGKGGGGLNKDSQRKGGLLSLGRVSFMLPTIGKEAGLIRERGGGSYSLNLSSAFIKKIKKNRISVIT